MATRLLKPTFLLTLLFAALVGLIRAQPYDDSELRAFLTPPDGCPMPCFMGIRPGVTTADEAIAILEAHEWVADLQVRVLTKGDYALSWQWNKSLPFAENSNRVNHLQTNKGIVYSITLSTHFQFGDLWLSLEKPADGNFLYLGSFYRPPPYVIHYVNQDIQIITQITCADFWEGLSTIVHGSYEVEGAISVPNLEAARTIVCWLPVF